MYSLFLILKIFLSLRFRFSYAVDHAYSQPYGRIPDGHIPDAASALLLALVQKHSLPGAS